MDVRKTLCVLSRTRPQYLLQWNQLQSVIQSYGLILIVFLSLCEAIISDDLIVETTKGKIRGVTLKSATNKDVDVWYGVPYAQPPVGDLRFRHPRPVDPWSEVKETTKKPNSCVQVKDTMFPGFLGSEMWNANTPLTEDCLYLNIAVPQPHPKSSAVLVWIYGGGFYSGTSTLDVYDPRVLAAEENIIVVAIQYRVASLGFMFFDTEDVPGNAALFDQLMALQWIKDNIGQFGGNPDNITIFGESAGGASVSLHLLSPLSRNLFNQAVMQSASALVPWGIITKEEAILRGLRLAEVLKCPHERKNIRATIECLRSKNATDLVNSEWQGIAFGIAEFPFVPVIDGAFLDETPQKSMDTKNFKKTNIMMGANKDEGVFFILYYLTDLFKNEETVFVNREDFIKSVGELNIYVKSVGREAIIYEYTDWLQPTDPLKNRDALDRMVGDYAFTCPVVNFAHRYAETGNNVYFYYFNERASNNPWPTWTGVLHGDEIAFIFGDPLNKSRNYDAAEIGLAKRMMSYWANFAKTGNPSLSADGTWTPIYWPIHSPTKREVLELNANVSRVLEGHRVKKCAFWKNFLPRLLSLSPPDQVHNDRTGGPLVHYAEAPRPCESTECCDGSTGGGVTAGATSTTGNSLHISPYTFPVYVVTTLLLKIFSAVPTSSTPVRQY